MLATSFCVLYLVSSVLTSSPFRHVQGAAMSLTQLSSGCNNAKDPLLSVSTWLNKLN